MESIEEVHRNSCDLGVKNIYCIPVEDYVDKINDYLIPNTWEVIVIILYILVFLVGVLGNFLVCFVVLRNEYMRTVTNVFLVNLAVSDFLVLIFCLPFTLIEDIRETWYFGSTICKLVKYLQHVSVTVSVLTLVVISLERWCAVCFPLKFKATTRRAFFSMLIIWMVGLSVGIIHVVIMDTNFFPNLPPNVTLLVSCSPVWQPSHTLIFKSFEFSIAFVLPLIFMSATYFTIGLTLWYTAMPGISESQRKVQNNHTRTSTAIDNTLRSRKRAALMLIVIVIMFFVCYMPVHIIDFIKISQESHETSKTEAYSLGIFAIYSHWLCFFNSAINPVVYNFMSLKFQREFKRAIMCKKRRHRCYLSTGGAHSIGMRPLHGVTEQTDSYSLNNTNRGMHLREPNQNQVYYRVPTYLKHCKPNRDQYITTQKATPVVLHHANENESEQVALGNQIIGAESYNIPDVSQKNELPAPDVIENVSSKD